MPRVEFNGPAVQGPQGRVQVAGTAFSPGQVSPTAGGLSKVGEGILNFASGILQKQFQSEQDQAVLAGARAAMLGVSEAELDTSWMTQSATSRGFQTTTAKLAVAKQSSDIMGRMNEYAKLSPDEFYKVLQEGSAQVDPTLAKLNAEDGAAVMQDRLTTEAGLIKAHQSAHAGYLTGLKVQAMQADAMAMVDRVKAGSDPQVQLIDAASWVQSVYRSDMPDETKSKLVKSTMQLANERGLYNIVGAVLNTDLIQDPTLRESLWADTRSTKDYFRYQDNQQTMQAYAQMWAGLENGTQSMTWEQYKEIQSPLVSTGVVKNTVADDIKFLTLNKQKSKDGDAAAALMYGDNTKLNQLGYTPKEAVDAAIRVGTKANQTAGQIALTLADIGAKQGYTAAYKKSGEYLDTVINRMGVVDSAMLDQDGVNAVNTVLQQVIEAQRKGDYLPATAYMSGMSDEAAHKFQYLVASVGSGGVDLGQAALGYTQKMQQMQVMNPGQKAAMYAQQEATVKRIGDSVDTSGWLSRFWTATKGLVSGKAKAQAGLAIQSRTLIGEEPKGTRAEVENLRVGLQEEARNALTLDPLLTDDEVMLQASAALMRRVVRVGDTLTTPGAQMILPRGTSPEKIMQLDPSGGEAALTGFFGNAVGEATPKREDTSVTYEVTRDGQVKAYYWNDSDGTQSGEPVVLDNRLIKNKAERLFMEESRATSRVYGEGELISSPTGAVRISGRNTAGVREDVMYNVRKALVEFEGIRDTPYKDGNGQTAGVGVHFNSPYYPAVSAGGRLTEQDISTSFSQHTGYTARKAKDTAPKLGWDIDNPGQAMFLIGFGYQAGVNWTDKYKDLAMAIATGDQSQAMQQLQDTAEFKAAQDSRKQWYMQTLMEAMNGR